MSVASMRTIHTGAAMQRAREVAAEGVRTEHGFALVGLDRSGTTAALAVTASYYAIQPPFLQAPG